jgi:histidinol dehydrogenase
MRAAFEQLPSAQRAALETAAARVRAYHEHQKMASWSFREADGSELGAQVTPLDRVGVYVPGGKAAYPSSVLMNVIPARVPACPKSLVAHPDGAQCARLAAAISLATGWFADRGARRSPRSPTARRRLLSKIQGPARVVPPPPLRRRRIDMVAGSLRDS